MVRFPGFPLSQPRTEAKVLALQVEHYARDSLYAYTRRVRETFHADPSTPFFLFKKDVAEKLNVPSVDLFVYRRFVKEPIPLEDNDMIVGALKSGDRLFAQRSKHRATGRAFANPYGTDESFQEEYRQHPYNGYDYSRSDRRNVHREIDSPLAHDRDLDLALAASAQIYASSNQVEPTRGGLARPDRSDSWETFNGWSNDSAGETVAQGTISQYSVDHGSSACASICLTAVKDFLVRDSLHGVELDAIVRKGVQKHQTLGIQHAMVDEIWVHDTFSETIAGLRRGEMHHGILKRHEGFNAALQHAMRCKSDEDCQKDRFGVLLTKSGETTLCLHHEGSWYLFDSHGESHTATKRAYLKRFGSMAGLATALLAKYPVQDFGGGFQSDMYNMFEATPVLLVSGDGMGNLLQNHSENEKLYLKAQATPQRALMDSPTSTPALSKEQSHRLSARIATCIVAARYCLAKQSLADIDFGPIARLGVQLGERLDVSGQALVDKVWNHKALADAVTSLQKGPVHKGAVDSDDGLQRCFRQAVDFMVNSSRNTVAVLLIISFEPVLCFLNSNSWYCFYTEGRDGETEMRRCGSMAFLAVYLRSRRAVEALHGSMGHREYEAHPIVGTPRCSVADSFDDAIEAAMRATEERSLALNDSPRPDDNSEASTTKSPYFASGGVFTHISTCIVATSACLSTENFQKIPLDRIIEHSVTLDGKMRAQGNVRIVDAWDDDAFSSVTAGLQLGPVFHTVLTDRTGFQPALQSVLDDKVTNQDVAVLLTTVRGTALCLQKSGKWYVLDTGGQTFGVGDLSSWRRFDNIVQLAEELMILYVQSSGRNVDDPVNNWIEAHSVVSREANIILLSDDSFDPQLGEDDMSKPAAQRDSGSSENKMVETRAEASTECTPRSQWDVVLSATMSRQQFLQSVPSLAVCIVAANAFLASDEPKSVDLEETLGQGFAVHHDLGLDRDADISTVWEKEGLSQFVRNMERGRQKAIHSYESLIEGYQNALEFCRVKPSDAATSPKVAVLLFNHYDAVLCIFHSRKWFLFEIYGNAKEQQLTAYLRRFSSAADLASALVSDHGHVPGSRSNILYEMLPVRYVGRPEAGVKSKDLKSPYPKSGTSSPQTSSGVSYSGLGTGEIPQAPGRRSSERKRHPTRSGVQPDNHADSCEEVGNMPSPCWPPSPMRLPRGQFRSEEGRGENAAIEAVQSISGKNVKVVVPPGRRSSERKRGSTKSGAQRDNHADSCEEVSMQSPQRPPPSMRLSTGQFRSVEGMGGENAAIEAVQSISSKGVKVIVTDQRQPNTCSASLVKGMIQPGSDDAEPPNYSSSLQDERCSGAASLKPREGKMQATELRRMQVVQRCDVAKATSSNDLCVSVQLPRLGPMPDDDTGRCSVTCCAKLLNSEPDRCEMCCQAVCSTCCDFYVTDIEDKPPVSPRAVCYDCAIEVVAAMSSPGMSQLQDYLHKTVLETYFTRLLNRASRFQNTVVAADMKGVLSPQTRRLEKDIESVKKRILELSPEAFLSTPEINREGSIGLGRRSHPDVGSPEGMTQEQLSILNLDATVHLIDRVSDLASLQQKKNKRKNLQSKLAALANATRQRCEIVKEGVASAVAGAVSTKDVNDLKRVINEIIEILEGFSPALKKTVKEDLARASAELDSCYEIVLQIQRKKTASRTKMRISSTESTLEESQAYVRALHDLSPRGPPSGLEYPTRNHLEGHDQLMSSLHQRGAASRKYYFLQGKDDILALTNTLEKLEDRLLDAERHAQEAKIKQQMLEERSRLEKAHQDRRNELNALLEGNLESAFSELSTQEPLDNRDNVSETGEEGSQEEGGGTQFDV